MHVGASYLNAIHHHHSIQFCVGLDGSFDSRTTEDGDWDKGDSMVIPPDCPHQIDSGSGRLLTFFLEPEHRSVDQNRFQSLDSLQFGFLDSDTVEQLKRLGLELAEQNDVKKANRVKSLVFGAMSPERETQELDPRIRKAMQLANRQGESVLSMEDMAEEVNLSASRFSHLFKESVSVPYQRYVLWQRLLFALRELRDGVQLTDVAHSAGFSDSAHFSRTFRKMFGMSPSDLVKNSQFVQVEE